MKAGFGSCGFMWIVAHSVQNKAFQAHVAAGGRKASTWVAFGTAMACLAICVAVGFGAGYVHAAATAPSRLAVPGGGEVLFGEGATEDEAVRLRARMIELGFFPQPATMSVERERGRIVVGFAVAASVLASDKEATAFADFADDLSKNAFSNEPVDIVLVDDASTPKRRFAFEKRTRKLEVVFDNAILYRHGITDAEAIAVRNVLAGTLWIGSRKTTVTLARQGGRVTISYVFDAESANGIVTRDLYHGWVHRLSRDAFDGAPVDVVLTSVEDKQLGKLGWERRPAESVLLGGVSEVLYRDGATVDEARAVAVVLSTISGEHGIIIVMRRNSRVVVAIPSESDTHPLATRETALALSKDAMGNVPVDIWVVDDNLAPRVTLPWGEREAIRPTP
jgi:hypothetical protein